MNAVDSREVMGSKAWIVSAFVLLVLVVLLMFYVLDSFQPGGAGAFGLVNTIGLATVAIGIFAAWAVLRRSSRT